MLKMPRVEHQSKSFRPFPVERSVKSLEERVVSAVLWRGWHRLPLAITGLDVRVIPFRRVAMVPVLTLGRRALIRWREIPLFDLLGHARPPIIVRIAVIWVTVIGVAVAKA
jgi:hypothetical protein